MKDRIKDLLLKSLYTETTDEMTECEIDGVVASIYILMIEVAEKAWDAASKRFYQEDYESEITAPDKETFLKELFPENV